MKNIVALSLLLAAVAVVVYLSPDPLYVCSVSAKDEESEGAEASLLKNVQGATKDAYQTAVEYAERTGQGIRQTGAKVADRVSSMVGGKPECEDVGTEQRSLLDRAAEAVNWRVKQEEEVAAAMNWRSKQEAVEEEEKQQGGVLSRAAESIGLAAAGDKSKEAHEAGEVSTWQRAKEKLNEASHAASEAASHVKDALFHKSTKEATGESSSSGQTTEAAKHKVQEGARSTHSTLQDTAAKAMETLTSAKDTVGEKLQEGAQATYSTLQDAGGKVRDTLGSATDKARETMGSVFSSTQETASQGAKTAYDTGARSAGSAYETAGEAYKAVGDYGTSAYKTAGDYGTSAYESARDKAAAAFDLASDKAGSAYETVFIAVQILAETVRAIPGRTAEYAASDRLGSATQSARDTASEVGSAAYERASGTGSSVFDTLKKAPESVQGTMEYVKSMMPDISTDSLKQRAREAGEYLPNVGEGLSYGTSTYEGILENLRTKLSFGRTEEERRGILDEFKNSMSGYSQDDRAGILDILKAKLGYAPREEPEVPQTRGREDEDVRTTIQRLVDKLAGAPTREERRGVLEEVKGMLVGYSKDERKGIIDGLKEKLASYIPRSEDNGVLEEWRRRVSVYFRGQRQTGPSLDDITKALAGGGQEERGNILEGLKHTLRGYSGEERRGPLDALREKLAVYSSKDGGKGILEELKRELAKTAEAQGKVTETAKGKLTEAEGKASETAGAAEETAEGYIKEKVDAPREERATPESVRGGQEGVAGGYDYPRQAVGGGKDRFDEESFFEYLKHQLGIEGVSHPQKPYHERGKETVESGGEQAKEYAGRAAETASEKLGDGGHYLENQAGRQNYTSERDGGSECGVGKRMHGAISQGSDKIGGYMGSARNLGPDGDSDGTEEFHTWVRDKQAREGECDCRCGKEHAPGSGRDVVSTVGGKVADVGHKVVDTAKEKTVGSEQQREPAETKGIESGPYGMNYLASVGPIAATADTVENISKPERKLEHDKGVDEKYEQVSKVPVGGVFTSLARMLYLAGFALSYGTSVWMTFLSGQVLSKVLTRHQFGLVQSRLFPAYLKVAAIGQAVAFLMHWFRHPWSSSDFSEKLQFINLCFITLAANLINILYLEPQVSRVMFERLRLEKEEGSDEGNGDAASTPKSKAAHLARQFNILHGYSSLVNLLSLVGQTWHLWYLSRRVVI